MKELLEYVVKWLVDNPDAVKITEEEEEEGKIVLTLEVAADDTGRVIGREGKMAAALRTLLRTAGIRAGKRVSLVIQS